MDVHEAADYEISTKVPALPEADGAGALRERLSRPAPTAREPVAPRSLVAGTSTRSISRSARSCSGTRCASAATTSSSTTQAGLPPVLHFDYEMVLDGRTLERPVNYALVRIVPPEGVTVDPKRRPYVIIDPRAGHGPGIGGFKDDSQVGVALRDGPSGLLRDLLPRSRAGPDAARRLRGRAAVRAQGARAASGQRRSRRSSATARAAGRR